MSCDLHFVEFLPNTLANCGALPQEMFGGSSRSNHWSGSWDWTGTGLAGKNISGRHCSIFDSPPSTAAVKVT